MGLMIHSLGLLSEKAQKDFYIYLLDYGWKEPLSEVLNSNFGKMADFASQNNTVILKGTVGHFDSEVLSWHRINGQPGENILPAILITTLNPHRFHEYQLSKNEFPENSMLLIPLNNICKTAADVINIIQKIFNDIENKKTLSDFEIAKELKKGKGNALVNALILQPNFAGLGIDVKHIADFLKNKLKRRPTIK